MDAVVIKRGREARLQAGHLWVYRGHIGGVRGTPQPGSIVEVRAADGSLLGRGYYNPRSEITVRLLTRGDEEVGPDLFRRLLEDALARRRRFFPDERAVRLVFGEGDLLPGLVVDRFSDWLVVQILTLGMEVRRELILDLLEELVAPAGIFERSDVASRRLEGLEPRSGLCRGRCPERVEITENGFSFWVDLARGHKTGYYLDQKENRRALAPLVAGARVLDAFCHTGSFGVHAAGHGAREVLGLDISAAAVALARENAARNGVADRCRFETGNAFDALRSLDAGGERFDCVILDPPAFARGKGAVAGARRGYKEINLRALRLLGPGGILVTCSCSYHVSAAEFYEVVLAAAADAGRRLRVIERRGQARDHPVLAGMPETEYLKCLLLQVL